MNSELNSEGPASEVVSELEAPPAAGRYRVIVNMRSSDEETVKAMLKRALAKANSAVALDTQGVTQDAIDDYTAACSILYDILQRTSKKHDQQRLQTIISTYENRIEELEPHLPADHLIDVEDKRQDTPELPVEPVDGWRGLTLEPFTDELSPPYEKQHSIPELPTGHVDLEKASFTPFNEVDISNIALRSWQGHGCEMRLDRVNWFQVRTVLVAILLILALSLKSLEYWGPIGVRTLPAKSSTRPWSPCLPLKDIPKHLQSFQDCSIDNFMHDTDFNFLETANPLHISEYEQRRNRLAQALVLDGLDAFMVEPGYTLEYYAAVSQPRWEVWEPEERPFVMVVRPYRTAEGDIVANTSFLVPSFEKERARLLDMPFEQEPNWITYEEHWNPYATLVDSKAFAWFTERQPKIMVDEEMRDFISRGLALNGFEVGGLGGEVERVRQIKSEAEVGILRAVNTGTVEAVRAMRKCMKLGQTEDDVMQVLDNTMRCAGLEPFFDIVLFDEDASNPHGGTDGSKVLEEETMVLIDVGAHLYGYSSDICRSFFGPWLPRPKDDQEYDALSGSMKEKLKVWDIVLEAQTASLEALHENSTAAAVDIAARDVISEAGYGKTFTHRVGHGIGIKAHESPYLNKGNVNTTLKAGMTFTSEPGIYLVDKFGVRHEDVLLVRECGLPELLTGQRARTPWQP